VITNSFVAIYLNCLAGNVISRNTTNDAAKRALLRPLNLYRNQHILEGGDC
jgi:hypothetical protein